MTTLMPGSRDQADRWAASLMRAGLLKMIEIEIKSEPSQVRSDIRPTGGRWYTIRVDAPPDEVATALRAL